MTDRERFEAWRSKARPVLSWTFVASMNASNYRAAATQADWEAWQASRKQALEEAKDACFVLTGRDGYNDTHWYDSGVEDCMDGINRLANPEGEQG